MFKELKNCIVCGASSLVEVFDMGNQYVVDFVEKQTNDALQVPLALMMCQNCTLVQLKHRVDPDRLYRKMWYRSGINKQMKDELLAIVQKAQRTVKLTAGDTVLDIGCNDGTLLGWYNPNVLTVGIDPCEPLVMEGLKSTPKRIDIGIVDYFSADAVNGHIKSFGMPRMKFKIITAVAMFYDLEDPVRFVKDCKELLHNEGVLVIQMNYLKNMLETSGFDNISHEHLAYYSVSTLAKVVSLAGLDLQGIEISKSNGGSIRAYITHEGFTDWCIEHHNDKLWLNTNVSMKIMEEHRAGLVTEHAYKDFGISIKNKMDKLKKGLLRLASTNTVYGYGASTRGTALVQYLFKDGGSECIKAVAERDTTKYGLRMVGTWWPIVPEAEARNNSKYMFVLPWHFRESIVTREKEWLSNGGSLIFPLPVPERVSKAADTDFVTTKDTL